MRSGLVRRVAALYAAIFFYSGMQMPFLPVWLASKGLEPTLIGLIFAIPMLARTVSVPLVAREADRRDALRATLVLLAWTAFVAHLFVGLSSGDLAILLSFAMFSLAYTPLLPLTETYAVKSLAEHGRAYGPVRLWGSLAYICGNLAAGALADTLPARDLIWPIVAAFGLIAVAGSVIPTQSIAKGGAEPSHMPLWRDMRLLSVLIGASLIQASHAVYYIFSALQWRSDGLSGGAIAALWALGVIAEIVLFAVSGRLALSPIAYILIGAAGATLRWGAMALDPPAVVLPALQLLHALSFGATHLGALTYVAQRAQAGRAARSQGSLAIAISLSGAAATALSGVLYSNFGVASYAAMALAAVAGGACVVRAHRRVAIALL